MIGFFFQRAQSLGKKYASAEEKGGSCCSRGGEAETATKPAVKSLSFAVDAGEVFGLLGEPPRTPDWNYFIQRLIFALSFDIKDLEMWT